MNEQIIDVQSAVAYKRTKKRDLPATKTLAAATFATDRILRSTRHNCFNLENTYQNFNQLGNSLVKRQNYLKILNDSTNISTNNESKISTIQNDAADFVIEDVIAESDDVCMDLTLDDDDNKDDEKKTQMHEEMTLEKQETKVKEEISANSATKTSTNVIDNDKYSCTKSSSSFNEVQLIQSLTNGEQNEILIAKFNLSLHRHDLLRLLNGRWLNDEIINFYLSLIAETNESKKRQSIYVMNTFFFPRLCSGGYDAVKRWTRKVNIFAYDLLFVPLNINRMHWSLAVISFKDNHCKYYDSMPIYPMHLLNLLLDYLLWEARERKKFDKILKRKFEIAKDVPQQYNQNDCGIFCCIFAQYLAAEKALNFSQKDIPKFRKQMIMNIFNGRIMD